MKKTLQRLSKLVMAVLLFGMCVLFSGCWVNEFFPRTKARFSDWNAVWVCDAEDFKISLETGEKTSYILTTKLTLDGEEMDVYVWIFEPSYELVIGQIKEGDTPESVRALATDERWEEFEEYKRETSMFIVSFWSPFLSKAEKVVTWKILKENPEYVGEKTFVGKEYVLYRQGD